MLRTFLRALPPWLELYARFLPVPPNRRLLSNRVSVDDRWKLCEEASYSTELDESRSQMESRRMENFPIEPERSPPRPVSVLITAAGRHLDIEWWNWVTWGGTFIGKEQRGRGSKWSWVHEGGLMLGSRWTNEGCLLFEVKAATVVRCCALLRSFDV